MQHSQQLTTILYFKINYSSLHSFWLVDFQIKWTKANLVLTHFVIWGLGLKIAGFLLNKIEGRKKENFNLFLPFIQSSFNFGINICVAQEKS